MFEKEAEEYCNALIQNEIKVKSIYDIEVMQKDLEKFFQDAAEFGYNKANEWHYTSKEDLPKSEGSYYVAMDNGRGYKSGAILNWVGETDCEEDFHWEDDDYECYNEQVYAWRECPVIPLKEKVDE